MGEVGCRRLVNKVAIITASSTGIGYGIADRFAKEGAKVIVSSHNKQHVDEAVSKLRSQGLEAYGIVCHVGKPEDRKNLVEGVNFLNVPSKPGVENVQFSSFYAQMECSECISKEVMFQTLRKYGGIDILVGNAAVSPGIGPILNFLLVKEVVSHMEKRGGGSIILVGSISGYYPLEENGIYCTTKTALIGLTKALAPQLSALNIRVNLLVPGAIKTDMSKFFWENEKRWGDILAKIQLHRIGQVHEIGGVAAFMASDDASYMTGESIVVAGGYPSRL